LREGLYANAELDTWSILLPCKKYIWVILD
jgi:hypothetical protein